MLPLPQMIFVWFAPTTHGRRQRFATDLNRQELLFCAQRRATNESVPSRIEIGRQIVVEDHSLRSWAGMPIEVYIREKAVDMSKHFGHEIATELLAIISKTVRMQIVSRQKQKQQILKGIRSKNNRPRLLNFPATKRIDILDTVGVAVAIREDANHSATGPQIEIARGQRLGDRGERRIPFVASGRSECITPGAVGGGWPAPVRHGIDTHRHRVRMKSHPARCLVEKISESKWPHRRHRQRLASGDERI